MAILGRLKDKIKSFMNEKKPNASLKAAAGKLQPEKNKPLPAKSSLGAQEVTVEKSKFSYPQDYAIPRSLPSELPHSYGKDRIALQVRDPWWLHTYWEITDDTLNRFRHELRDSFNAAKKVLRAYDVSSIIFNGKNAHRFIDIEINPGASSWYIDTASPGTSWCVDYGLLLPDGRFITILRSNTVTTPLAGPSWITDEEWMIPDELFAKLYGVGVGLGSSPLKGKKPWKVKRIAGISSGSITSPIRKR